jgi:glycosyltransferase involved in cell wall biosynthesis
LKKSLVSVFIPSFNYERFVGEAIESILSQTYTDWELIIVDDASSDRSPEIIEQYRRRYPDRIRTTFLETNVGQSESTNIGLQQARGEFIALLAADDRARPDRLKQGVALLQKNPNLAAAFSRAAYIDGNSRPVHVVQDVFNRPFTDLRWQLLEGNFLCGTSVLARLEAMHAVGGYNRTLGYTEDYDLWLRLLDRHEIVRTDDIWVDYRLHGKNLSVARTPAEQPLGPLYESVGVAVRAMHRWHPSRLHEFRNKPGTAAYRKELADVQVRLAGCCLRLHRQFIVPIESAGGVPPGIATGAAYGFLLDALQNEPDNQAARDLLNVLYTGFNDQRRVETGRSATLGEIRSSTVSAPAPEAEKTPAEASADAATPAGETDLLADYGEWSRHQAFTKPEAAQYDLLRSGGQLGTRFHLATIMRAGADQDLVATLKSLSAQYHDQLILTVVTEGEAPDSKPGDRLRWLRSGGDPFATARDALIRGEADWIGLIGCGDLLSEASLLLAAEAIRRHPEWLAVYFDDDERTPDGSVAAPRFKPEFDATLNRCAPYIDDFLLVRWDAFAAAGGLDPALREAAVFDLGLKLSERGGRTAIGHIAGPHLHRQARRPIRPELALAALQKHLARSDGGTAGQGPVPGTFTIDYPLREQPKVSLIIPTRNRLAYLSRCLESILEKTTYAAYEVLIVDNASDDPDTVGFLSGLSAMAPGMIRVLRHAGDPSLAACLNAGAQQAEGSLLLFLHDDVAAVHQGWLEKLVAHALRKGVGAVSARLVGGDGAVQHAGIVLGMSGCAELLRSDAAAAVADKLHRLTVPQEVAAASAACLLVNAAAFEAAGGFNLTDHPYFLFDVDLCLRLSQAGWRTVWTPEATLLHNGPARLAEGIRSALLDPAERAATWQAERQSMLRRWLPELARDPHYSRLLSLNPPGYERSTDLSLTRDNLPWKPLPRILAQPGDRQGCGYYRISAPLFALDQAGVAQGHDSQKFYTAVELERISPDLVVLQRPYTDSSLANLELLSQASKARRIFDMDDLLMRIPEKSVHARSFPRDLLTRLKKAASLCDWLVVSTEPLARELRDLHPDIRVAPNRLPKHPWLSLAPQRRIGPRPRVGWAGALGHEGDLQMVAEVFAALAGEVDWIILGPCPEVLKRHAREAGPMVPLADYPAALASLNLDLAIAPLEVNGYNESKSALKLLEYGVLGYPVVCTDIAPYQGDFPVARVRNTAEAWIAAIREQVNDAAASAAAGDALREHVLRHWMLDDHLDDWRAAWGLQ